MLRTFYYLTQVPFIYCFSEPVEFWHFIGNSNITLLNKLIMIVKVKTPGTDEKEWENPRAPENTSDDRDKEQLIRQFKEAKRRKDNLSTEEPKKEETEKKDI